MFKIPQTSVLPVAAINWNLQVVANETDFFDHMQQLIVRAAQKGAELVVLPELFLVELTTLLPHYEEAQLPELLHAYFNPIVEALSKLAVKQHMVIVAGSLFHKREGGIFNTCPIIYPDGSVELQDKLNLIAFEKEVWHLHPGQKHAQASACKPGVCVCFDSEFPTITTQLVRDGMTLLCVPSHCDTVPGYFRVHYCCRARAIENQIFVVQACLVGNLPQQNISGVGPSTILAPLGIEISETGILSQSSPHEEDVIVADLDFESLWRFRRQGAVKNWKIQFDTPDTDCESVE